MFDGRITPVSGKKKLIQSDKLVQKDYNKVGFAEQYA